jgi:hypothetical protein
MPAKHCGGVWAYRCLNLTGAQRLPDFLSIMTECASPLEAPGER